MHKLVPLALFFNKKETIFNTFLIILMTANI